jgi:hypothetical protein
VAGFGVLADRELDLDASMGMGTDAAGTAETAGSVVTTVVGAVAVANSGSGSAGAVAGAAMIPSSGLV